MKRRRFPIALMMAAVAAVAINFAVWRTIDSNDATGGLAPSLFACGVVPMASLLILVALTSVPTVIRVGRVLPFVVGFEALGWAAVFAFITCNCVAPSVVRGYNDLFGPCIRPVLVRHDIPIRLRLWFALGAEVIIFSTPQLFVALLGGWLTRKLGLTVRFERRITEEPAAVILESTSYADRAGPPVLEWQMSN